MYLDHREKLNAIMRERTAKAATHWYTVKRILEYLGIDEPHKRGVQIDQKAGTSSWFPCIVEQGQSARLVRDDQERWFYQGRMYRGRGGGGIGYQSLMRIAAFGRTGAADEGYADRYVSGAVWLDDLCVSVFQLELVEKAEVRELPADADDDLQIIYKRIVRLFDVRAAWLGRQTPIPLSQKFLVAWCSSPERKMSKVKVWKAVDTLVEMGIIDRVYPEPEEVARRRREDDKSRITYYYLPTGTPPFEGWTPDMDRQGKPTKVKRQRKAKEPTEEERHEHLAEVFLSTERRPSHGR